MTMVRSYAAVVQGEILFPYQYQLESLGTDEVEIQVAYCGLCYSDLSMLVDEWGLSRYPLVPGHEIVGTIIAVGTAVHSLQVGQRVGVGWYARTCMTCECCLTGHENLCFRAQGTIIGRHGGFADRVRAHHSWVIPLPPAMPLQVAAPLLCSGNTVFNALRVLNLQAGDRVGVIGIGGLGHLAIQFLKVWGCVVIAFSSHPDKEAEARRMGATEFVNSCDVVALEAAANSLDVLLSTVNADLNWSVYMATLRPKGRLHFLGFLSNLLTINPFALITNQYQISGTPSGSPSTIADMLEFAARHQIAPIIELFPLREVNAAIARVKRGEVRYRVVLQVGDAGA